MGAAESLLVAGIVCIVAAVVGGGVKMLGAEMPVLSSFGRQALLFAVGLAFLFASFIVVAPKSAPPASASSAASPAQSAPVSQPKASAPATPHTSPSAAVSQPPAPAPVATLSPAPSTPARRCAGSPLDCLPKSSAPIVFADPAAARAAAAQNLHDGLSTSEAEIIASRQGAGSSIARACGIVASDDSSPLGKHDAAERVIALALVSPSEVNPACRKMSQAFL